jgi:hypothetical protein
VARTSEPFRLGLWSLGGDPTTIGTRVLAECEAKRRIVAMHEPTSTWDRKVECEQCSFHEAYDGLNDVSEPWPCETLRLFALPFADHPDFSDEWRP